MSLDLDPRASILAVDDVPANLALINNLLSPHYRVRCANGGARALTLAQGEDTPDLILLDILMPDLDGYEVCARLKAHERTKDVPVIFFTSKSDVEDEERGLAVGAVDYITKPLSPPIVLARVKTHLALKASSDFLRDKSEYLEAEVARRARELTAVQDVTIHALASLAETRDASTGHHIRRTQHFVRLLAQQLRDHPRFKSYLTERNIDLLFRSAPLHDLGKVGIPDHILKKPGKLTPEEYEIMKTHTTLGYEAIDRAEKLLGTEVEFLATAKEIALAHQEKWDGTGYPRALAGDRIPISARLMALADVYDALASRRIYRDRLPHDVVTKEIVAGSGKSFDPDVVEAYLQLQDRFAAIAHQLADTP
ncbi:two-component system response regulator [Myxococcota bacterium]|nr:two-component system response regulator [Myxococcota bacterium]